MQSRRPAVVPLLLCCLALGFAAVPAAHAVPRIHTVALGAVRRVPYTPPETAAADRTEESTTLRVRALLVDGVQREWTVGEIHEVTDRSFTVRRALRLNDALPGEAARWSWQPGPWLQVDRVTGHILALHLPAFDPAVSEVAWFRDYAAYCGVATGVRGGLVAVIAQLGGRKAVAQKVLSKTAEPRHGVCGPAHWQRAPMRVTLQATGGEPVTFDVVGTSSLIEDGDGEE